MHYPVVYDKLDTSFLGYGLAVLENAKDVCIREVLNGEYPLSFALPISDSKWQYIVEENFVKVGGQLFVIRNISNVHGEEELCTVNCEHVFFLLLDEYIEYLEFESVSATNALSAILEGTAHSVGVVDVAGMNELYIENQNPVAALNTIINTWHGELRRDNWAVDLLTHRGSTVPNIQFRYQKNIKSINRTVDTSSLITRLYVYGNDGLTIEDATEGNGMKYIDSQYINNYRRPKKGTVTFDIDDQDELYTAGLEYLATAEIPAVSYEVDVIELKALSEYGELEEFALGDEAMVIDEVLGINVQARIIEYEWYPLEPSISKVTLANFRPGIQNTLSQLRDLKDRIVTTDGGVKLSTAWFEGIIDTMKNQLVASGSYATAQVIEGKGMLFENTNISSPDYGAVYIGPGVLAIANTKSGSPRTWNWRTFGTGKGIVADHVSAAGITAGNLTLTDLLKIRSSDGRLQISGTELKFLHANGTESRLNSLGLKLYDNGVFQPYISTIEAGTIEHDEDVKGYWTSEGGSTGPVYFIIRKRGVRWAGQAANINIIVQPAITLSSYDYQDNRDGSKDWIYKLDSIADAYGSVRSSYLDATQTASVVKLDDNASTSDGYYTGLYITINGETRKIIRYRGDSSHYAYVDAAFSTTPTRDTLYSIHNGPGGIDIKIEAWHSTAYIDMQTLHWYKQPLPFSYLMVLNN